MQFLKQSTAATTVVGPVLDSAGAEYTGAVIGDLTITKNGTSAAMASAATLTHIANGHYTLVFTTGNTDTLGRVDVHCNKATYQMPPKSFQVLAAAAFDTLVTNGTLASTTSGRTLVTDASGLVDANTVKVGPTGSGTAQTARDLGASVLLSSGTGTGQLKLASGYVAMTWADIAAPTTTVNLSGTSIGTAAAVTVVNGLASGVITATSIASNALTAAKLDPDVTTELQAGLATAANLATVAGYLDTEIAAILEDTGTTLPAQISSAAAIADKILGRNLAGGSDGGRTVTDALRFLRNRWSRADTTLTVYAEDDTTPAWTSTLTLSAVSPVTESNPP